VQCRGGVDGVVVVLWDEDVGAAVGVGGVGLGAEARVEVG
jgi:hypothetical protein